MPARRTLLTLLEISGVLLVAALTFLFIHPSGNFPLLDDWDFAIPTWHFADTGEFRFTKFTAVSLRALVLWGALWTKLFGKSFEVLRASTITLSLLTLVVINRTLARTRVPAFARVLATFALFTHPIFLWASCTFMTDVPFVFASAVCVYFWLRALDEDRMAFAIAASVAIIVASFIRQTGIVTSVAVAIVLLLWRGRISPRWWRFLAVAIVPPLLFTLLFFVRPTWVSGSPSQFRIHYSVWQEGTFRLPEQVETVVHYSTFNLQNCALFFLPLILAVIPLVRRLGGRERTVAGLVLALIVWRVGDLAFAGLTLPYFTNHFTSDVFPGNVFVNLGLGPVMLSDVWSLDYAYPFALGSASRLLLTAASALLAWVLFVALVRALRQPLENRPRIELLVPAAIAVCGTVALFASRVYYDRYSLDSAWSLVLLLPLLGAWEQRRIRIAAIAAFLLIALFSIFSVQEYFAWNRARWTAFAHLRARGVAVANIDAGGEAVFFLERASLTNPNIDHQLHERRTHMLAFRALPNHRVIERVPFVGWLGLHRGEIVAQQEIAQPLPH